MTNREFALSLPAYLPGIRALFSRPVTHLALIKTVGPYEAACGSVSEDDDLSTNIAIVTCPQCLRRGSVKREQEFVDGGIFGQLRISVARKAGQCDHGRRTNGGELCRHVIAVGEKYANGPRDIDRAGGFGFPRWCLECVASLGERRAA